MWEAGYSYKAMSTRLRVTPTELALIAIDLDHAGQLPERQDGFWGAERG